jgi:pretoxin HINT domain-containing protein
MPRRMFKCRILLLVLTSWLFVQTPIMCMMNNRELVHNSKPGKKSLENTKGFLPETKVLTPHDGPKEIYKLKKNDLVLSYNTKNGEVQKQPITALVKKKTPTTLAVTTSNDNTLYTTLDQEFFDYENRTWKPVNKLRIGDLIATSNHGTSAITNIKESPEKSILYDIEVNNNHNFFVVGKENILVHNPSEFVAVPTGFAYTLYTLAQSGGIWTAIVSTPPLAIIAGGVGAGLSGYTLYTWYKQHEDSFKKIIKKAPHVFPDDHSKITTTLVKKFNGLSAEQIRLLVRYSERRVKARKIIEQKFNGDVDAFLKGKKLNLEDQEILKGLGYKLDNYLAEQKKLAEQKTIDISKTTQPQSDNTTTTLSGQQPQDIEKVDTVIDESNVTVTPQVSVDPKKVAFYLEAIKLKSPELAKLLSRQSQSIIQKLHGTKVQPVSDTAPITPTVIRNNLNKAMPSGWFLKQENLVGFFAAVVGPIKSITHIQKPPQTITQETSTDTIESGKEKLILIDVITNEQNPPDTKTTIKTTIEQQSTEPITPETIQDLTQTNGTTQNGIQQTIPQITSGAQVLNPPTIGQITKPQTTGESNTQPKTGTLGQQQPGIQSKEGEGQKTEPVDTSSTSVCTTPITQVTQPKDLPVTQDSIEDFKKRLVERYNTRSQEQVPTTQNSWYENKSISGGSTNNTIGNVIQQHSNTNSSSIPTQIPGSNSSTLTDVEPEVVGRLILWGIDQAANLFRYAFSSKYRELSKGINKYREHCKTQKKHEAAYWNWIQKVEAGLDVEDFEPMIKKREDDCRQSLAIICDLIYLAENYQFRGKDDLIKNLKQDRDMRLDWDLKVSIPWIQSVNTEIMLTQKITQRIKTLREQRINYTDTHIKIINDYNTAKDRWEKMPDLDAQDFESELKKEEENTQKVLTMNSELEQLIEECTKFNNKDDEALKHLESLEHKSETLKYTNNPQKEILSYLDNLKNKEEFLKLQLKALVQEHVNHKIDNKDGFFKSLKEDDERLLRNAQNIQHTRSKNSERLGKQDQVSQYLVKLYQDRENIVLDVQDSLKNVESIPDAEDVEKTLNDLEQKLSNVEGISKEQEDLLTKCSVCLGEHRNEYLKLTQEGNEALKKKKEQLVSLRDANQEKIRKQKEDAKKKKLEEEKLRQARVTGHKPPEKDPKKDDDKTEGRRERIRYTPEQIKEIAKKNGWEEIKVDKRLTEGQKLWRTPKGRYYSYDRSGHGSVWKEFIEEGNTFTRWASLNEFFDKVRG